MPPDVDVLHSESTITRQQYRLLLDIYVFLDDGDRRVLKDFQLGTSDYALLMLLGEETGQRLTTLSERLLLAKSTVTRIVDRLEQAGWVQRIADSDDRRAQRVILTPAGLEHRARACEAHTRSLEQRLGVLTPAEQHQLNLLLDKLRAGLHAMLHQND